MKKINATKKLWKLYSVDRIRYRDAFRDSVIFSINILSTFAEVIPSWKNILNFYKFVSMFYCVQPRCPHCVKIVRFRSFSGPYSVRMRENMDQKNSEYGQFLRSVQIFIESDNFFSQILFIKYLTRKQRMI